MKTFLRTLVVLASLSPLACSAATTEEYKLGQHYMKVRQAVAPANPARIEVLEVFAYSCPHCYSLEPLVRKWRERLPADVEFVRSPHSLGMSQNEPRNRAFYAARMLNVLDRFHPALFDAVHKERKTMATPADLRALFVQSTGLKGEEFDGAFGSFAADAGFRRGENAIRDFGITSVPTMVVDGKYFVSPNMSNGLEGLLKVTDHLIERARKERAKR
jgi:protein dithiol oxidoreductase (disulfide-forming)